MEIKATLIARWECPYCGQKKHKEIGDSSFFRCVCEETGERYEVYIDEEDEY